jgi:hypothetical protein
MFSFPSRFETSSIVILSWPATSSRPRKSKPTLRMGFGFAITINSYYDSSSPPIRDSSSEIKRTRCYCQDGKFPLSNRRFQFNIPILNTNRRSTTATHDARISQIEFLILSIVRNSQDALVQTKSLDSILFNSCSRIQVDRIVARWID